MNKSSGIKLTTNLKILKNLNVSEKVELINKISNMLSTFVEELLEDEVEIINITGEFTKEDKTKWIN